MEPLKKEFPEKDLKEPALEVVDKAMKIDVAKTTSSPSKSLVDVTKGDLIQKPLEKEVKLPQREEPFAGHVEVGLDVSQETNTANQDIDEVAPTNPGLDDSKGDAAIQKSEEEHAENLDLSISQNDQPENTAKSSHGTSPSKEGKDEHPSPGQPEPTTFGEVNELAKQNFEVISEPEFDP